MLTTPYANFWARFAAALLDGIILYIPTSIVSAIIFSSLGGYAAIAKLATINSATDEAQTAEAMSEFVAAVMPAYLLSLVVTVLAMWLYNALMESSSKQATLGKMALGVVVVSLDGKRISFARATGRFFSKFFLSSILMIGYILAAFTEKKQALHDIIAGTLVVDRR
jgi:uncharacterized RDD family membrane protein YckC